MFIKVNKSGYDRDGSPFCHGLFLMIFQDHNDTNSRCRLKALVRYAKMSQCGQWMMARVTLGGKKIVLSGCYGSDGLPIHLPTKNGCDRTIGDALLAQLVDVPPHLVEEFWNGGGHNTGGKEMDPFKKWALDNLKSLRKPIHNII